MIFGQRDFNRIQKGIILHNVYIAISLFAAAVCHHNYSDVAFFADLNTASAGLRL